MSCTLLLPCTIFCRTQKFSASRSRLWTRCETAIIITGDASRNKTMCVPGGGFASIKIELPRNWDQLMEKAGYKPLRSFYLKSELKPSPRAQQFKFYRRRNRWQHNQ